MLWQISHNYLKKSDWYACNSIYTSFHLSMCRSENPEGNTSAVCTVVKQQQLPKL